MKRSKEARKQQSHQAILSAAVEMVRKHGVENLGVAEVMAAAGLTVGGFYSHFGSKEDLIRAAVPMALADAHLQLIASQPTAEKRLQTFVDWYTSVEHRDCPETGCLLPAIVGDLAEEKNRALRPLLAEAMRAFAKALSEAVNDPRMTEQNTAACLTMLVGAMALARAVRDTPLSEQLLAIAREKAPILAFGGA